MKLDDFDELQSEINREDYLPDYAHDLRKKYIASKLREFGEKMFERVPDFNERGEKSAYLVGVKAHLKEFIAQELKELE